MDFNFPANTFAAGDNGVRSISFSEKSHAVTTPSSVAQQLAGQNAVLFSLLPNGRLQQIYGTDSAHQQGAVISESDGALCWRVLASGKPTFETVHDASMLAVPVREPLLPGYPGVLLFVRADGEAPFAAKDVDAAVEQARAVERNLGQRGSAKRSCGVMLIDAKFKSLLDSCGTESLDPQLRCSLLEDARSRFGKRPRRMATRVRLRDRRGIVHNFRVEQRKKLPIGDGVVLAYTAVPNIADWSQLDESAFENTPEISRLMPALKFMIAKYASLPGLTQIASKAKLSPYHFHREFSSLLGISPKHLMLDCQVESAGRQLERGDVDLVDIARSCGFAHQSHFTSRFKQASGLTPTAWRRAVRAAAD